MKTNTGIHDMTAANENDPQHATEEAPTVKVTIKYLHALRQAAGLNIDPETAEVHWT